MPVRPTPGWPDHWAPGGVFLAFILIVAGAGPAALALPTSAAETSEDAATSHSGDPGATSRGFEIELYRAILSDALAHSPFADARYEIGDLPVEDGTAGGFSGSAAASAAYRAGAGMVGQGVRIALTLRREDRDEVRYGVVADAMNGEHRRGPVFELAGLNDPLPTAFAVVVHDDAEPGIRAAADQRLLVAAINTTFDANIVEAIHEIFQPTEYGPDSTRFSVFGRGEFVLTRSIDGETLSVADLQSGVTVAVQTGGPATIPLEPVIADPERALTIGGFMHELGRHLLLLLNRPSVVALLGIGFAFWLFWWLRRRSVAIPND